MSGVQSPVGMKAASELLCEPENRFEPLRAAVGFICVKRTLDDIGEFSNRFLGKASEAPTGLELREPADLGSRSCRQDSSAFACSPCYPAPNRNPLHSDEGHFWS